MLSAAVEPSSPNIDAFASARRHSLYEAAPLPFRASPKFVNAVVAAAEMLSAICSVVCSPTTAGSASGLARLCGRRQPQPADWSDLLRPSLRGLAARGSAVLRGVENRSRPNWTAQSRVPGP